MDQTEKDPDASRPAPFTLAQPFFLAGKSGASCALALLAVRVLDNPDVVTASFVAVLCCAPAALMGLRTSFEQLTGSAIGGLFGTLGAYLALPIELGVPLAVTLALLCTHGIGFYRGTVAAAFTALFVQIIAFGDPFQTFGYRIEAVGIAGVSAFVVNVVVSAFFYESLFRKRLRKVGARIDELLRLAGTAGPSTMHSVFGAVTQLDAEIVQAIRELGWRGNEGTTQRLRVMRRELVWLRDYAHLIVDLELTAEASSLQEVLAFLRWLPEPQGDAPPLGGDAATTRERIVAHLKLRPE